MGDLRDDFRAMDADRKERHARWHRENREAIEASDLPYTDRGEALLFRFENVRADFYPSTGRWRDLGTGKTHSGGAENFLRWLERRRR